MAIELNDLPEWYYNINDPRSPFYLKAEDKSSAGAAGSGGHVADTWLSFFSGFEEKKIADAMDEYHGRQTEPFIHSAIESQIRREVEQDEAKRQKKEAERRQKEEEFNRLEAEKQARLDAEREKNLQAVEASRDEAERLRKEADEARKNVISNTDYQSYLEAEKSALEAQSRYNSQDVLANQALADFQNADNAYNNACEKNRQAEENLAELRKQYNESGDPADGDKVNAAYDALEKAKQERERLENERALAESQKLAEEEKARALREEYEKASKERDLRAECDSVSSVRAAEEAASSANNRYQQAMNEYSSCASFDELKDMADKARQNAEELLAQNIHHYLILDDT